MLITRQASLDDIRTPLMRQHPAPGHQTSATTVCVTAGRTPVDNDSRGKLREEHVKGHWVYKLGQIDDGVQLHSDARAMSLRFWFDS